MKYQTKNKRTEVYVCRITNANTKSSYLLYWKEQIMNNYQK